MRYFLRAALGLLLLGALRAFPKDRASKDTCAGDPNRYYDKDAGRCCYRCSPGMSSQQPCPQGSADCKKQCMTDYYLNEANRCTACVSCSLDDLVEKKPCTRNSPRVCECKPGMFCITTATNTCARCTPHSTCPPGMSVKFQGTAKKDTVCEFTAPETRPSCSTSSEDCKAASRNTPLEATSNRTLVRTPEDASKVRPTPAPSSSGKSSPDLGLSPAKLCRQGSADCRKQCDPDYYLDKAGRCTACVSCLRDDLVEKTPCTRNSPRVCECRRGMVCTTPVANSCARCVPRPTCPSKMAVKSQDLASRDTTPESSSSKSPPECSNIPEETRIPASTTSSLMSPLDPQTSKRHGGSTTHAQEETSVPPTSAYLPLFSTQKPILAAGPVLLWVPLLLVAILISSIFLLCYQKACGKGIRQKLHLCFPGQTFQPELALMGPLAQEKGTSSGDCQMEDLPYRSLSGADTDSEVQKLTSTTSVETSPSVGTACPESLRLLGASPPEAPSCPRDAPESQTTSDHTNNKIENIYIMKADTVIVGTVRTEVPENQGVAASEATSLEEDLEVDHAPHYPEQETEPPLGSSGDVMFSVEEEGKEEPLPTSASEK
ncbi:tumor necrosis factor receptor superfamily member 8 [Rhynchocyon petersi]